LRDCSAQPFHISPTFAGDSSGARAGCGRVFVDILRLFGDYLDCTIAIGSLQPDVDVNGSDGSGCRWDGYRCDRRDAGVHLDGFS
jgi:hypothetical protein